MTEEQIAEMIRIKVEEIIALTEHSEEPMTQAGQATKHLVDFLIGFEG